MSTLTVALPSTPQRWRKKVSRIVATIWLAVALFTLPRGFAHGWHEAMELTGFLLLTIAALGRIWAMLYVVGRKNRELCQAGPYSLTRNPLYLFSFIGVLGFAFALQHLLLGLIAAGIFLTYYAAVIRGEEAVLFSLHGDAYAFYCDRVPRFWPRLALPESGGETLVVHTTPLLRGLREVFWFLAAIVLADVVEWAHVKQLWPTLPLPF